MPYFAHLCEADRRKLERALWEDVTSEFDERFLTAHLLQLPIELSTCFWGAHRKWAREEREHHGSFLAVYRRFWGHERDVEAELLDRRPNFEPLQSLFADEFRIACLAAYDEYATVRVYTHYLDLYDKLGPDFGRFLRSVITDEAHHYASFLRVAARFLPDRAAELPGILQEIRALEGTPYAATFLLDHDNPVFSAKILAGAERALLDHLAKG